MNTILRKYLPADLVNYSIGKYNGVTPEEVQSNRILLSTQLSVLCEFEVEVPFGQTTFQPFKYNLIDEANEAVCQKLIRRIQWQPVIHVNRFSNESLLEMTQRDLEVLETHRKWHRRSCYDYHTKKKTLYKQIDYYQSLCQ